MPVLSQFFADLLYFPHIGRGILGTFRRGLRDLRAHWGGFFFHGVLEPALLFLAFGFGIGALIPQMQEQSYAAFLLPGLVVVSSFVTAFFEGSHGTFDRFQRRVYEPALRLGIHSDEIIAGEALFAAFKGLCTAIALMILGQLSGIGLGRIDISLIPIVMVALTGGSLGVFVSTVVKSADQFSIWTTCVIVPLVLFSGSYFPVTVYPFWSQSLLEFVPIVQAVQTVRMAFDGDLLPEFFLCVALLFLPIVLFLNLASARWARRLESVKIRKTHRFEYDSAD